MVNERRLESLEETGGNLRFLHAMLHEFRVGVGSRVLEVGCGTGLLGSYIAACSGAIVIGTEKCPYLAKIANLRIPCLHMADGSLPDLPAFDLIVCKDVLPMIDDHVLFLKSIRKSLLPGGGFVTYVPVAQDFDEKLLYKFVPESREQSRLRYGDLEELIGALKLSGFQSVATRRLFLGSVKVDHSYVDKHKDGFFSNTEGTSFEVGRLQGLKRLTDMVHDCDQAGLLVHYEWERTLVVAR